MKVDRSTRWGNAYRVGATYHEADFDGDPWSFPPVRDAAHSVELYRRSVTMPDADWFGALIRSHLGGKNLACWCKGSHCHADVLLELANAPPAISQPASPTTGSAESERDGVGSPPNP